MSDPRIYEISNSEVFELAKHAIEAKKRAYCPYSNFRVGAAILLAKPIKSALIHAGANVEAASTPNGVCAERCAIQPVVASVERPDLPLIRAIAVSTDIWPPTSPCGMCRQVIREFCEPDVKIFMYGRRPGKEYAGAEEEAEEESLVMTIGDLLPLSFGRHDMDKRANKIAETTK